TGVQTCALPILPPDFLPVEINIRKIICRPKIDEKTSVRLSLIIKSLFVPDGAFIEQQAIFLSIPISRHLQGSGAVEIILNQIAFVLRLGIFEIAVGARLVTIIIVARFVGIDDCPPLPIKADGLAAVR